MGTKIAVIDIPNTPLVNADGLLAPNKDEQFVANFFNVSIGTVRLWRYSDSGPRYFKVGALVRYRLADLLSYTDSLRPGGQKPELFKTCKHGLEERRKAKN
jgi:hypothetical protein